MAHTHAVPTQAMRKTLTTIGFLVASMIQQKAARNCRSVRMCVRVRVFQRATHSHYSADRGMNNFSPTNRNVNRQSPFCLCSDSSELRTAGIGGILN